MLHNISKMVQQLFRSWFRTTPVIVLLAAISVRLDGPSELRGADTKGSYELGKRTYQIACSSCHGKNGDAQTPFARALNPRPRDFTRGVYKFRSTFPGVLPTDEDLRKTIERGIPGTSMPAWKGILSEPETEGIIQYIKNFYPFFTRWTDFDSLTHSSPPGLSPEGIARGKETYKIMGCWSCHGMQGRGDGPSAKGLLDEEKRPIKAYDFTSGNMKGGSEMTDIYRTLSTGLRGTPMPSFYWAFLFTREGLQELLTKEIYQKYFSGTELDSLKNYIETVLPDAELNLLDSTRVKEITDQRRWDLVQYIYSLRRNPDLFSRLFLRDHELTR